MLRFALVLVLLRFQDDARPLPDLKTFISEFRKSIHTDDLLLSNYTYTEKQTSIQLDSARKPKKTEENVFQVFPGTCERAGYRRQTVKNGKPLSEAELDKQDREHEKQVKSGGGGDRGRDRPRGGNCNRKAEDEKIINDLFAVYEIQMVGREPVDGRPTVLVSFKPRPNYKPETRQGGYMKHVAGRAWISEEDHQLARLDAEVIDDIGFGLGVFAKLKKGTHIAAERHKFNNEIWLPYRTEIAVDARVLFKGVNMKQIVEYADHKRFSVDTKLSFPELTEQPEQ
jgi:hypothetical protein